MPTGTKADFKIYSPQFYAGWNEVLQQNTNVFNAASGGAIRLVPDKVEGDYETESFLQELAVVSHRDTLSTGAAAATKLTQGEHLGVKLNRRIGPVENTIDSFRKMGKDGEEFSFRLGEKIAKEVMVEMVNTALLAAASAVAGVPGLVVDRSGTGTMKTQYIVEAIAKFGDAGSKIRALAMHSKVFYDLWGDQITEKLFTSDSAVVYNGAPVSLNFPLVVTDSSSLLDTVPVPDQYFVLGLVDSAITIKESEEREVVTETVTGLDNLVLRLQGEYAYNLALKGYAWDKTAGGENPDAAALGAAGNWDQVASDVKETAGVLLKVQ